MTKVICIKNRMPGTFLSYNLTIGKIYDAEIFLNTNCYLLIDDGGERCLYDSFYFEPLALYREKRINQILDED